MARRSGALDGGVGTAWRRSTLDAPRLADLPPALLGVRQRLGDHAVALG